MNDNHYFTTEMLGQVDHIAAKLGMTRAELIPRIIESTIADTWPSSAPCARGSHSVCKHTVMLTRYSGDGPRLVECHCLCHGQKSPRGPVKLTKPGSY